MGLGFEFEFGWQVRKLTKGWGPFGKTTESPFAKYHVLFQANGWNLECDPPGLEFVTKPAVDESEAGRNALKRIMNEINTMCLVLEALQGRGLRRVVRGDFRTVIGLPPGQFVEDRFVMVPSGGEIRGVPQINAGLRLTRIRTVLRDVATPNSPAAKELIGLGGQPAYYQARVDAALKASDLKLNKRWKINDEVQEVSAPLRGMLALIAQYIEGGERRPNYAAYDDALKYAKQMTYLMSRTDFGKLFRLLPAEERHFYRANGGTEFRKLVRKALKMSVADMNRLVIERGLRAANNQVQAIPITRRDWITAMTQGHDLIRENADTYGFSGSLGGLGHKVDRVKDGAIRAPILEFRQVRELRRSEWRAFALDAFDYIRDVNANPATRYQITNRG